MPKHLPAIYACGIHAVDALINTGRAIYILAEKNSSNPRVIRIKQRAHDLGLEVRLTSETELTALTGYRHHQGIAAAAAQVPSNNLADVINPPTASLVVLDGVDSPQNLGAILRTARAFAVRAVIIPKHGAAPLSAATAKAASGAAAQIPLIRVVNLKRALNEIRLAGFCIVGTDENGDEKTFMNLPPPPLCWVLGGEKKGLRRLTRESCDFLLRIPTVSGDAGCLNVSTACAICLAQSHISNKQKY